MNDELITSKEQWYDLTKYKDEVAKFVTKKKADLDNISKMKHDYEVLYRIIFSGAERSDIERFPFAAEMYKVYKAALIQACLAGYSGLLEASGIDGYSTLKAPELKEVMTEQFKGLALLENLSNKPLIDWILKGEAVAFMKLKETKEEFRTTQTVEDAETGEKLMTFKIKQGIEYKNIEIVRIDPLDFFVDANDYDTDPRGCVKIIRSWISPKTLLSSDAYPLLSRTDKENIVAGQQNGGNSIYFSFGRVNDYNSETSKTAAKGIEVLTFYGDYITQDYKVLKNIKATVINRQIADIKYNPISTNRIIYAPYFIDDCTHRGISPLSCVKPINKLVNRVTDLFIQNLDDASNPVMMYQKGSFNQNQREKLKRDRELEYQNLDAKPEFYAPPLTSQNGLVFVESILQQSKNTLGINNYISGDTSGSVRTARESEALFQSANARMRVETDVFSYNFLLKLFVSFYAFNRELALAFGEPLHEIYADPNLKISISTNASRADKEGELSRLMQMLNLPIAQMIFSNLSPQQVVIAIRYLMAKAELTDADNLLELIGPDGQTNAPPPDTSDEGTPPPVESETEIDATIDNSASGYVNNINNVDAMLRQIQ